MFQDVIKRIVKKVKAINIDKSAQLILENDPVRSGLIDKKCPETFDFF